MTEDEMINESKEELVDVLGNPDGRIYTKRIGRLFVSLHLKMAPWLKLKQCLRIGNVGISWFMLPRRG